MLRTQPSLEGMIVAAVILLGATFIAMQFLKSRILPDVTRDVVHHMEISSRDSKSQAFVDFIDSGWGGGSMRADVTLLRNEEVVGTIKNLTKLDIGNPCFWINPDHLMLRFASEPKSLQDKLGDFTISYVVLK